MVNARDHAHAGIEDALTGAQKDLDAAAASQKSKVEALRNFLSQLADTRTQFDAWFAKLKQAAGKRAADIPPPPQMPDAPASLGAIEIPRVDLSRYEKQLVAALDMPPPTIDADEIGAIPRIEIPAMPRFPNSAAANIPGVLGYAEIDMHGRRSDSPSSGFNAFDLQVPGFAVTFLLIGMLMGVSMAIVDEREWGTLARLRSTPSPFAATFVGKLLARFGVGVVQMVVLFAAGSILFGVSLGKNPLALLMPIAAISFAGAGLGILAASAAPTRDAVLPIGTIVVMTIAAIGGCWWPLDFEPAWMQRAALAVPTTWAMRSFNDLMIRGLPAASVIGPSAMNLAYGGIYMIVGIFIVRRRV
jgi:ABC-type multidrug transport system permease subunit